MTTKELELECIFEAIDSNFTRAVIIIDTAHEELISNIIRLLDESNITYSNKWQSKYNDYVIYDYEPFCIDGFNRKLILERTLTYKINWVLYNANRYIKAVNNLNKLLEV